MQLPLNFRDFGGQITGDGRRVLIGRLYRSGHLAHLAGQNSKDFLDRNIAVIVDLRYADEQRRDRSPWPNSHLDRVITHDGDVGDNAPHLAIMRAAGADLPAVDQAYQAFYRALPFDPLYRPLFVRALRAIAGASGPVLIHCTAGKDRTGTLVALLLALLGADDHLIEADFMRSNDPAAIAVLREEVRKFPGLSRAPVEPAVLDALIGVRPAYIAAALGAVRNGCGSVEAYFAQAGIEPMIIEQLRSNFLAGVSPGD